MKQLPQSREIVPQDKRLSPLTPSQEKADLITSYVEKYAVISGRPVTPTMYAVYIEALEDLETRRLEKGLRRYLQEGEAWPWPGTLRTFVEEEV